MLSTLAQRCALRTMFRKPHAIFSLYSKAFSSNSSILLQKKDLISSEDSIKTDVSTTVHTGKFHKPNFQFLWLIVLLVKETTKTATYGGIMLIGLGVTGALFYAIFSELFSNKSPNGVYSKALDRCIKDDRVLGSLGEPIKGYGEETRRGRRRHVRFGLIPLLSCIKKKFLATCCTQKTGWIICGWNFIWRVLEGRLRSTWKWRRIPKGNTSTGIFLSSSMIIQTQFSFSRIIVRMKRLLSSRLFLQKI